MGFKREICSLCSWCKKLKFNQVEKLNSKAGRIWEDSLRGHGVCLTAFSKRQGSRLGLWRALVPCFLWITVAVPAVLNAGLSVKERHH